MKITTVSIPEPLQQRLQIASKRRQVSASRLAQQIIDEALIREESEQLERMYRAWDHVKGIGKKGITDLSQNVDDILYGEQGAWRGREPMTLAEFKTLKHGQ